MSPADTVAVESLPSLTEPPPNVEVPCVLHLELRSKGGNTIVQFRCTVTKRPKWTIADFIPFAVAECAEWGIVKRWDFERVRLVGEEVHCDYSIPQSKSWPLERALYGCGWMQVGRAKMTRRGNSDA